MRQILIPVPLARDHGKFCAALSVEPGVLDLVVHFTG